MLDWILQWDYALFYYINQRWISALADLVFPFLREPLFWTPLYVSIFAYVWLNKGKSRYLWLVYWALLIVLCDGISSHIIKNLIFRPRPCIDPIWQDKLRLLVNYCSHRSSFTSSHAVNHFGMASFFALSLYKYWGRWVYLFFLWAFLVAYAQVYVGLHYPLDILSGGLIGGLIGILMALNYNKNKKSLSN